MNKEGKIKKLIYCIVPGIKWLKGYTAQDAVSDLIAGTTIGLTILPQALAYATLAGLEPQYGLYSAILGSIIYALLGSCPQVSIGPTALLSLMTSKFTGFGLQSGPAYAILLCLLAGIVEMIMALLRLGALVDLISEPVTTAFTSATAVIIGTSQIKGLLGLRGGHDSGVFQTFASVVSNLKNIRVPDATLGIISIAILLMLRKLKDINVMGTLNNERKEKIIKTVLWVLATARNALLVLFTSLIAYFLCDGQKTCSFTLTGKVRSGFPDFQLPKFETDVLAANGTVVHQTLGDMLHVLGSAIFVVPIIAVLGNVAISKAFGGSDLSPTREMISLSLSNIAGSFCSSMPVTGSFSRSAVNQASGVRTPLSGIYTSSLVILALGLLAPYFQFIPKPALSAVIISAVIFMIEIKAIKILWRCNRRELLPAAITFIVSLYIGVELGLLLGVLVDVAFLVYKAAKPDFETTKSKTSSGIEYIMIEPKNNSIYFPAIETVRNRVKNELRFIEKASIVLNCSYIQDFDFTASRGLSSLNNELSKMAVPFFLLSVSKDMLFMLKESTGTDFATIDDINDLNVLLDQSHNFELQLTIPLINQKNQ